MRGGSSKWIEDSSFIFSKVIIQTELLLCARAVRWHPSGAEWGTILGGVSAAAWGDSSKESSDDGPSAASLLPLEVGLMPLGCSLLCWGPGYPALSWEWRQPQHFSSSWEWPLTWFQSQPTLWSRAFITGPGGHLNLWGNLLNSKCQAHSRPHEQMPKHEFV